MLARNLPGGPITEPCSEYITKSEQCAFKITRWRGFRAPLQQHALKQDTGPGERRLQPSPVKRTGIEIEPPLKNICACTSNRFWQIGQLCIKTSKARQELCNAILARDGLLHGLGQGLLHMIWNQSWYALLKLSLPLRFDCNPFRRRNRHKDGTGIGAGSLKLNPQYGARRNLRRPQYGARLNLRRPQYGAWLNLRRPRLTRSRNALRNCLSALQLRHGPFCRNTSRYWGCHQNWTDIR